MEDAKAGTAERVGMPGVGLKDLERVKDAFDAPFYLEQNPDVARQGLDPFVHYMTCGWREGRNPSANFNSLDYLLKNPHVLRSGTNPLVSWVAGEKVPEGYPDQSEVDSGSAGPPSAVLVAHGRDSSTHEEPDRHPTPPSGAERLTAKEMECVRKAFDATYYLAHNPDVGESGVDPFQHYMRIGWREHRDPNGTFSTAFYLRSYPDIGQAGINPFAHWVLHGSAEKRTAISFEQRLQLKSYLPTVSAIVPNFNHAKFLTRRIESILDQTYPNIQITILDDCSTDDSRQIIQSFVDRYPGRIRASFNGENSGGVFRQWRKGILETEGELVWICESDDFCEPDFVEKLVPYFRDESVQIAFGRILSTNAAGQSNTQLDDYRESSEPGIWNKSFVQPAAAWFAGAFGVHNVIANVGGSIWRRGRIPEAVWEEASAYRVVGDWFLYSHIAQGGQIAWEPDAVAYFRQHGTNTSSTAQSGPEFYNELERLMLTLRNKWDVPDATVTRFHAWIAELYDHLGVGARFGPLEGHCSLKRLLEARRNRPHILIAMLGFTPGGGEVFPINLANGLLEKGWTVSVLVFDTSDVNVHMRHSLDPAVSVYEASWVVEYGADRFLENAGISLIHSHMITAEMYFFKTWQIRENVPYLVTLHGSYEVSDISQPVMALLASRVDHFVYLTEKNLAPLNSVGISRSRFTKLPNAMPLSTASFPKSRSELGIPEDAVVFTLVARGIKRKGWRASIEAFTRLRDLYPHLPMHLCLAGEGEEPDRLKRLYGQNPDISFLGYQPNIHGLYRITDVAIVPTRFAGESYPLCIIEAFQVGTPVIASNVGEIRTMVERADGLRGGLLIEPVRKTDQFIARLTQAMESALDASLRKRLAIDAEILGRDYDMGKLVDAYGQIYDRLIGIEPSMAAEASQLAAAGHWS